MTAPLFTSPWFRPLNDAGAIMPGAKLVFYASGTTDPEDVYADGDLDTSLGNEIVADASGRFAPFYLDPTVLYRAQLYDVDDVLQPNGDVDPLIPVSGQWIGEVRMHDGPLEDVPAGWIVLDGTNGTADSRDRFPRGVGSSTTLGDTGGSDTASGTTDPAGGHDHGGDTGETSLTEAQGPPHHHRLFGSEYTIRSGGAFPAWYLDVGGGGSGGNTFAENGSAGNQMVEDSGDGDPHDHPIDAELDHEHDVSGIDIVPSYFGIYFIKFVGA